LLACLEDRSSRPHRSPRLLSAGEQERICAARRRSGWGPRLIAGDTGHAHATVWRTLKRAGISRAAREPRERPRLYELPCPGDLLHIDSKRFARFTRPGHAVTGDRHVSGAEKRKRVGYEWVHSLVDVECPRFRGQPSAGLSGLAERLPRHAKDPEVSEAVPAGVSP
jgi:hypothetical protein